MDKAIIMSDLLCHLAPGYRLLVVILDGLNFAIYIYFFYLCDTLYLHILGESYS